MKCYLLFQDCLFGRWGGPAGCRRPFRAVLFEFELRAGVEGAREIPGILDRRDHQEERLLSGVRRQPMEVLRDRRILAVGHAILSQVPLSEICRHHLQQSLLEECAVRCWPAALAATTAAGHNRSGVIADLGANRPATATGRSFTFRPRASLPGF